MTETVNRPKKTDKARERNACCEWDSFVYDFEHFHSKWFDAPPTKEHWATAVQDWRAGSTGWEAAHNAQRCARSGDAARKAA